jgi:hypothetical protein
VSGKRPVAFAVVAIATVGVVAGFLFLVDDKEAPYFEEQDGLLVINRVPPDYEEYASAVRSGTQDEVTQERMIKGVSLLDEAERRGIVGAGVAQMIRGNLSQVGEDSFAGELIEVTENSLTASEFTTGETRRIVFSTPARIRRDVEEIPFAELLRGELILVRRLGDSHTIMASGVRAP